MVSRSPMEGAIFGVVWSTEKHCEALLRCTEQKISDGISATAVSNCIASDWSVSHQLYPREKSAPAMRPLVKIL